MKKAFLFIIILLVSYIVAIFLAPSIIDSVSSKLGLKGLNQSVRDARSGISKTATTIPSIDQIQEDFNTATKEVENFSNTVILGVKDTKETIDSVRATFSGAEDTYKKTKEVFKETSETISNIKDGIESLETLLPENPEISK